LLPMTMSKQSKAKQSKKRFITWPWRHPACFDEIWDRYVCVEPAKKVDDQLNVKAH